LARPGTRRRGAVVARCVLPLLAAGLALSCARGRPDFRNTFDSPEALAAAVLDGVARNDRADLESLALSQDEFQRLVWPGLPAARPERNLPWDYVWKDLQQKSAAGLSETLARHGGRRYQLEAVTFAGHTSQHDTFEVRREAVLHVRTGDGIREPVRLFGSALVSGGRWKLFSYVTD
jgi:hypothetical protein